jgi:hypothetical protein
MIYAIIAIQFFMIVGIAVVVNWMLTHLAKSQHETALTIQSALTQMKSVTEESQGAIREIVSQSNEQVVQILDKAYRDREILLERIQHPEYMKAQAPAADKGAKSKPHTMDEEREFELEHPDAPTEEFDAAAIIPGARREDDEIKPVEPVRKFGKGRSENGSTE